MRLHQKPIPRSLALFCCLLHCSPRIRLSSVFCCWLLTLDCTVCTWFEFGLIFLLSLFFSLPHSAVRWSAAPSFFCPSAINVLTVDNVPIPIRNLIYFSLLCTAGNKHHENLRKANEADLVCITYIDLLVNHVKIRLVAETL